MCPKGKKNDSEGKKNQDFTLLMEALKSYMSKHEINYPLFLYIRED